MAAAAADRAIRWWITEYVNMMRIIQQTKQVEQEASSFALVCTE